MSAATQKPWEHRRWRGGVARGNLGGLVLASLVATAMFLGAAVGVAVKVPHSSLLALPDRNTGGMYYLAWALAGIGIYCLFWTMIAIARWWRFGKCQVRMATVPGVIGGRFAGEVELPSTFPNHTDVRIELFCLGTLDRPGRGSDDHGTISTRTEWSRSHCVRTSPVHWHDRRCGIPFDFTIPYGLHDATDKHSDNNGSQSYDWRLKVVAGLPGADLNAEFIVPVFKTVTSDPAITHVPEDGEGQPLDDALEAQGEWRRLRIERGFGGRNEYVGQVTPVRWLGVLILGVFGLIFGCVAIVIAGTMLGGNREMHAVFAITRTVLLLLPLLLTLLMSWFLLYLAVIRCFIKRRTWVADGLIHQRRHWLGVPLPSLKIHCKSVREVSVGRSSSHGRKSYEDVTITVRLPKDRSGKMPFFVDFLHWLLFQSIPVATDMTRREAEEAITALRREINRQRSVPLAADGEDTEDDDKTQRSA